MRYYRARTICWNIKQQIGGSYEGFKSKDKAARSECYKLGDISVTLHEEGKRLSKMEITTWDTRWIVEDILDFWFASKQRALIVEIRGGVVQAIPIFREAV